MSEDLEWKLEIKKVNNGYVARGKFCDSDYVSELVIEEGDEKGDELKSMQNLLWLVMEYFGIFYCKHNTHNIKVLLENTNATEFSEE